MAFILVAGDSILILVVVKSGVEVAERVCWTEFNVVVVIGPVCAVETVRGCVHWQAL